MLKKGDFIRVEYTGSDKNGNVFDTTNGEMSKNIRGSEGPMLVIFGFGQLIDGLEEVLKSMNPGDQKELTIKPEKAFGEKNKELLSIMKPEEFLKNKITPRPGLPVHVEFEGGRSVGIIKSVNSGRVLVDFNHPLAGQDVTYKIKLVEIITDFNKKLENLIRDSTINCKHEFNDGKLKITVPKEEQEKKDFTINKFRLMNSIRMFMPEVKHIDIE